MVAAAVVKLFFVNISVIYCQTKSSITFSWCLVKARVKAEYQGSSSAEQRMNIFKICSERKLTCWSEGLVGELLDELELQPGPGLRHPLPEQHFFSLPPTLLLIHLISFSNWTISVVGVIRMSKVSSNLWIVIQAIFIFRHTCLEPRWSEPLRWLWWGWLWSRLQVSCSGLLQAVPSLGLCAEEIVKF